MYTQLCTPHFFGKKTNLVIRFGLSRFPPILKQPNNTLLKCNVYFRLTFSTTLIRSHFNNRKRKPTIISISSVPPQIATTSFEVFTSNPMAAFDQSSFARSVQQREGKKCSATSKSANQKTSVFRRKVKCEKDGKKDKTNSAETTMKKKLLGKLFKILTLKGLLKTYKLPNPRFLPYIILQNQKQRNAPKRIRNPAEFDVVLAPHNHRHLRILSRCPQFMKKKTKI